MHSDRRLRIYTKLLSLYPGTYRQQYGNQMLATLHDMLENSGDRKARAAVWLRVFADLPASIVREQLAYTNQYVGTSPSYIKISAIVGALLLLPFFVIAPINDITKHSFYHSWLWHVDVLFVWIIALPAAAAIISCAAFVVWVYQQHTKRHVSLLRSVLDVRHSWPVTVVASIGAAVIILVLFHDSIHCIAGNPVRELGSWHATWQCVQRGSL